MNTPLALGIIHAAKVLGWVAASGLVTYLAANGIDTVVPHFSQNWPYFVPIVNAALAGGKRWLDERNPEAPAPTPAVPPPAPPSGPAPAP